MASAKRTRYVLAYDVVEDSKRTRLANLLLDYGDRVQKSVFEADLTHAEVQEILIRASNILADEDSLRLYPLCRECQAGIRMLKRAQPVTQSPSHRIV